MCFSSSFFLLLSILGYGYNKTCFVFFFHSSVHRQLFCFQFSTVIEKPIIECIFKIFLWKYVSISLKSISSFRIHRSQNKCMITLAEIFSFQSGCTIVLSHQQYIRIPFTQIWCYNFLSYCSRREVFFIVRYTFLMNEHFQALLGAFW